jgi:hypothetical protein
MNNILVALAVQTLKAGTHPEAQAACWLIIDKWNRSLNPRMYREPGDPELRAWYGPECWSD